MRVHCAPAGIKTKRSDLRYVLYEHSTDPAVGSIGPSIISSVRKFGLAPSARAWDFLSIALSVIGADEGCTRATSPDGWTREIELTVSVADPKFWTSQTDLLAAALCFLTGDIWYLTFVADGLSPTPPKHAEPRQEDAVCLLSGGMDSLIGALDLRAAGKSLLFVSQVAKGDKKTQSFLAQAVGGNHGHLQLNHLVHPPGPSERSQRARSLIFLGFGVLAATSLQTYTGGAPADLYMPENGFISINVALTPLRLGSLSTRTTHPYFIGLIQQLLGNAGINVRIVNPYQFKTKGEMLVGCQNQAFLKKHIGITTSCGRYARSGFMHCGRCVPCLVRRSAFHRWGTDPTAAYKFDDLSKPDHRHRDFDDVRSVGMAIEMVRKRGFDRWAGGAINAAQLGDTAPYRAVVQRGLKEMSTYLKAVGAL
ncbi:MAG: Qat anti-phage system QueC-like protein QatC [Alphaproteobacteria bacterium]